MGENTRDVQGTTRGFDRTWADLPKDKWKHQENKRILIEYIKACMLGTAKSGNSNKRIAKITLYRIIGIIRMLSEQWLKKDFDHATQKDWDTFYEHMETGKIRNNQKREYTQGSKSKMYKTIRKFARWRYGHDKEIPEFCSNWVVDEGTPQKDYVVISRGELDKMLSRARVTAANRTALAMLWDGGFRSSEFQQLTWEDLTWIENKKLFQVHVRREIVKGGKHERFATLPIATPYILDLRKKLLKERRFNASDFMFPESKKGLACMISRVTEKYCKKRATPHDLRHSSITHYADVIPNLTKLCFRYWGVAYSREVNRYVHKRHDDIMDEVEHYDAGQMKVELATERVKRDELVNEVASLRAVVEALAEDFMQTGSSALASVGATKELEDVRDNYEGYKTELIKDAMKSSSNKKV